jgi:hypothetical protein
LIFANRNKQCSSSGIRHTVSLIQTKTMISRYLGELFSVFYRWWWGAITGIFTLLSVVAAPESGITIGRAEVGIVLFLFLTLFFLVISLITVSWRWYAKVGVHPTVREVFPEQRGSTALTFVVQPGTELIPLGSYLALFRLTEHGVEACAAVLQVISDRTDGQGLQAEVRWMSAHHRPVFQKGQVNKNSLRVRVVNGEALTLVEKCVKEGL